MHFRSESPLGWKMVLVPYASTPQKAPREVHMAASRLRLSGQIRTPNLKQFDHPRGRVSERILKRSENSNVVEDAEAVEVVALKSFLARVLPRA